MLTRKLFTVASCMVVLGLLVASCASEPSAPPPARTAVTKPASEASAPTPTFAPAAAKPRYGGILKRALSRDVTDFDLQRASAADASATFFNVYEGLVRLDPIEHEKIRPELAEKWEGTADGKAYTFTFQNGIKWHDGKRFSMDDVKYSLERMQNPKAFKTISPRGEAMLAAMDRAEIVDETHVKITLKFPSASFLPNIATGWVAIAPKSILEAKGDMRRDAVGTGPFKLKEHSPNISLELEKNSVYHISGSPYLDGIKFYVIKDAATRFAAFRTGQVKMTFWSAGGLSPTEAEFVKREMPDIAAVYEHDGLSRALIFFNLQRKPWNDIRVRRAVDLVFDRQAALRVMGTGYIGSMYMARWGMALDEVAKLPGNRQPKDADFAEAQKLMAEAGYAQGFKTTLLSWAGGAFEMQAVIVKDQLAKLGIDAELGLVESATADDRMRRKAFDLFSHSWQTNTDDPDETLFNNYRTGGAANYGGFSEKDIDELIDKQARTLDGAARKTILADIEKRSRELIPVVDVFRKIMMVGAWREVNNFSPGPGVHPWGKLDQVWLAK
ncbi:MAG: ABC transporter substrate-binding protein [Chloroflexi bacterium]|nr:ABC transporter substrate-binding protein [Chloroflexota bacterium]